MQRIALWIGLVVVLCGGRAYADAPRAGFRIADREQPHVGVAFHLDLVIEGFEEAPAPAVPALQLADATVTFVDAQPNVSRSIQIMNGQRTESARVSWVMRWRVEPRKEGRLRIPPVTVLQGSNKVTTQAAEADVDTVPTTDAMKLQLALPARPIFVGETVPVTLTWTFRGDPSNLAWSLPLLSLDAFTASGPPVAANARNALTIPAGAKELQLPYQVEDDGQGGRKLTTTFFLAPRKVGKLDVPASSVVAGLPVGPTDFFGNARTRLFRAVDAARTLEVKPLPETDKPANFAGAVGEQFSIDVTTSRSVVKLGEPVELAIRIKSNQRLDTLSLGRLDGPGGLPKDKLLAPSEPPTGELSDDGKTKTFKVVAQVTGPATEVPAIAFAYFDPAKTAYQTIHSEPIALSVAGGSVVSASDVVAATAPKPGATSSAATDVPGASFDAELALSSPGQEHDRPLGGALLWLLVGVLYAVPLALLLGRRWQLRTQGQREDAAELRAARRRVEELLDRAGTAPARDVAGPLAAALRELARQAGAAAEDEGVVGKLETESFAPSAATVPLSADLRSDAAGLLRRWTAAARRRPTNTAAALLLLVGASLAPRLAHAEAVDGRGTPPAGSAAEWQRGSIDEARAAYQDAMQVTGNASARKAAFVRAATAFGQAVRATPDRPELLTDWGNAALGAGDVATATLAYRRALALDGANARARHNLAQLRVHQPETFRPVAASGATDTLLFFHVAWSHGKKLLVGGAAFALAILLLVPWSGRRRRGLGAAAILPFAIWIAMLASVLFEDTHADDAIVMDAAVLRAADSAGAPAALPQPLPRGAEVIVLDHRDTWTKIRIASGMSGWVPSTAVERVVR